VLPPITRAALKLLALAEVKAVETEKVLRLITEMCDHLRGQLHLLDRRPLPLASRVSGAASSAGEKEQRQEEIWEIAREMRVNARRVRADAGMIRSESQQARAHAKQLYDEARRGRRVASG
jgi:hypothetical protein